jgi:HEAT repeat protein
MKRIRLFLGLVVVAVAAAVAAVLLDPTHVLRGHLLGEVFYRGRPASYWGKCLTSEDPSVQAESVQTLTDGGESATDVLVVLLKQQGSDGWQSAEVRWKAAEILGRLGPKAGDHAADLIAALKDDDMHVRTVVAESLGTLEPPPREAIPALISMLEKGDPSSTAAAKTLGWFGEEAAVAVPTLCAALKAKDSELRFNAAKTLGRIGPSAETAIPALVAALKDEVPRVRERSAESLGDIGPKAAVAVPDLIALLKDPDWRVRRDAVRSLGKFGPAARSAIPMLKTVLDEDKEDQVSKAAARSLRLLGASEKGGGAK